MVHDMTLETQKDQVKDECLKVLITFEIYFRFSEKTLVNLGVGEGMEQREFLTKISIISRCSWSNGNLFQFLQKIPVPI